MTRTWKTIIAAALCALAYRHGWAQAPEFAVLDVEWENSVAYFDDVADASRLVTSPGPVATTFRNFMQLLVIADIVSVNGKPARGSLIFATRLIQALPNPSPGQAIGDLGRFSMGDLHMEILQSDGTPIGSIMSSGFGGGPAPPGLPAGVSNFAVVGGSGLSWEPVAPSITRREHPETETHPCRRTPRGAERTEALADTSSPL